MEPNLNISIIVELFKDSKEPKSSLKDLSDRAVEATKNIFIDYGINPSSFKNATFMDLIKTFKDKNSKQYSLTAELVCRDIKELLYSNIKQTYKPEFNKYLQADKHFKKVDVNNQIFTMNNEGYGTNNIQEELVILLNKLTINGYISLLLILATLRTDKTAIEFTLPHGVNVSNEGIMDIFKSYNVSTTESVVEFNESIGDLEWMQKGFHYLDYSDYMRAYVRGEIKDAITEYKKYFTMSHKVTISDDKELVKIMKDGGFKVYYQYQFDILEKHVNLPDAPEIGEDGYTKKIGDEFKKDLHEFLGLIKRVYSDMDSKTKLVEK